MDQQLEKIPGVIWNFSQPIADNMEEAVSGVKGELAAKMYGDDLQTLEDEGRPDCRGDAAGQRHSGSGVFRVLGQPNLNFTVDRDAAARYQINVADVQDAIQTAVGGNALTQVLQGERATTWCFATCRNIATRGRLLSISASPAVAASAFRWRSFAISRAAMALRKFTGKAMQRYIAIKYSVRGRDLGGAVEEAIKNVNSAGAAAARLSPRLGRRVRSQKRAAARLADYRAAHDDGDLRDPVYDVPFV